MSIIRVACAVACVLGCAGQAALGCSTAEYLYVAAWSPSELHRFCVEASGALSPVGSQSLTGDAHAMAFSADRAFAYLGGANLRTYAVSWIDGSLTPFDVLVVGNGTFSDLAVDGTRLFGTHSGAGGAVLVFDIGAGAPELVQTRSEPVAPRGLALLPVSNQVLVANGSDFFNSPPGSETIGFYAQDSKSGLLATYVHGTETPAPDRFAVSPSGVEVYFTMNFDPTVASMTVGPGIATEGSTAAVGEGSSRLATDAGGSRLYVANGQDGDISVLRIEGVELTVPEDCPGSSGGCRYLVAGAPVDLAVDSGGRVHVAGAGPIGGSSTVSVLAPEGDGLEFLHAAALPNPFARLTAVARFAPDPGVALTAVTRSASDVQLHWSGASGPYQVYRAEECVAPPGQWLMTTSATTATDSGAPLATLSCYRVFGATR